jgi:hypothetical protein
MKEKDDEKEKTGENLYFSKKRKKQTTKRKELIYWKHILEARSKS